MFRFLARVRRCIGPIQCRRAGQEARITVGAILVLLAPRYQACFQIKREVAPVNGVPSAFVTVPNIPVSRNA